MGNLAYAYGGLSASLDGRRDLYQCRHTFASLMLQAGEDPAWVARVVGHTTTKMLYERYHRFIQHRTRSDGEFYLKRLEG